MDIRRSLIRFSFKAALGCLLASSALVSFNAYGLQCQDMRKITNIFLTEHFSQRAFDSELSKRTLDTFIKSWDPGKLYFFESDIQRFTKSYGPALGMLTKKNNCTPILDVYNTYVMRFKEKKKTKEKWLAHKFDFKKDEYIEFDRKKIKFATTPKELDDRWRKNIKYQYMQKKLSFDDKKSRESLHKRFTREKKRIEDINEDKIYGSFLESFATALDPHSSYLSPSLLENFRIRTKLSLEGIGATLRSEEGYTIVVNVVPGGAAQKGGLLKTEDKIIAVAQGKKGIPEDVIDMDLNEVVKKIRGAPGTTVTLTVLRKSTKKTKKITIPIVREKIELKGQAAKSRLFTVKNPGSKVSNIKNKGTFKVGVIELPSFYRDFQASSRKISSFKSSTRDTLVELNKLKNKGADAIIIDLRGNGGGSLIESITLSGLFIKSGPIVMTKSPGSPAEVMPDRDPQIHYDGPLLVMIDKQSASASEIFAGAIKDYGRGLIVGGKHTFGKGSVQNLSEINAQLGAVKITTSKFYRPSGYSTQLDGVASDISYPSVIDAYEFGEKFYDYALPGEKITAAKFKYDGRIKGLIADLKKRSMNRVKTASAFDEIRKDIKEFEKNKDERTRFSLKEDKSKEDKKDEKEEVSSNSDEIELDDDASLQETLMVASDLIKKTRKQSLDGSYILQDLKPKKKTKAKVVERKEIKKMK